MSRTVEDILKAQLGSLLLEVAILTSRLEVKEEELKVLKMNVREPDKTPAKKE